LIYKSNIDPRINWVLVSEDEKQLLNDNLYELRNSLINNTYSPVLYKNSRKYKEFYSFDLSGLGFEKISCKSMSNAIENFYESEHMKNFALICVGGKLYKSDLFRELRFEVGKLGEDGYLNQKIYLLAEKTIYLNAGLYAYRQREGSSSRSWTEKWMHALVDEMSERITLLASLGYPLDKHLAVYRKMLDSALSNGQASTLSDTNTYKELAAKKVVLSQLTTEKTIDKKAVVLAANYAYVEQVMTTIKSICYHNRSIRFYLINSDFPNEWFKQLNKRLERYDSEIINCRVTYEQISRYKTDISYTVFLRYFVSDFVQEDKALYLDCDLVVTKNLDNLFETDLQDYPLAAVRDYGGRVYYGREMFNAGVLLINNRLWKQENMSQRLIDLTNEWHDKVDQADQSILNMLFENRWIELEFDNNHVVIHKQFTDYELPAGQDYPGIIHYLSHRKPWFDLAAQSYRDVWWYYHSLEWTELGQNHHLHPLQKSHIYPIREPFTCLIYTSSDQIEQIDTLIQSLPNIQFKIAARVMVSDRLKQLLVYPNVTVYAGINYLVELDQELIETSQVLLDINHGEKTEEMLDQFSKRGKLILAFENTKYREMGQITYKVEQVQEMIEKLREVEEKHGF
ncbi:MAG: glycosyltransferase, partial [Streptococcus mitis]|nr:glycosyltransferase [Streptococcus mitis]